MTRYTIVWHLTLHSACSYPTLSKQPNPLCQSACLEGCYCNFHLLTQKERQMAGLLKVKSRTRPDRRHILNLNFNCTICKYLCTSICSSSSPLGWCKVIVTLSCTVCKHHSTQVAWEATMLIMCDHSCDSKVYLQRCSMHNIEIEQFPHMTWSICTGPTHVSIIDATKTIYMCTACISLLGLSYIWNVWKLIIKIYSEHTHIYIYIPYMNIHTRIYTLICGK